MWWQSFAPARVEAHDTASWEGLYDALGLFDDEARSGGWPAWRPPVPPTAARRGS